MPGTGSSATGLSLRFDDTNGFSPSSLQQRARGVFGVLTQTKTTGKDKLVSTLPVFVSHEAWIEHEWLLAGLELWQGELGYSRDYFLCLPSQTFAGTCGKRAKYSDAKGFSSSLLASLRAPDGSPLLLPAAVGFWTEHSDRCGLDTWLGALSVGADLRKFVGRWAAGGAEDRYVRSATRITENCQRLAAKHARAVLRGGADHFGEEETLEQLRAYLGDTHHGSEEDITRQVDGLTCANNALPPVALGSLGADGAYPFDPAPQTPSCSETAPPPASEEELPEMEPEEPPLRQDDLETMLAQQVRAEHLPPPAGFVISVTQGGRCRRLHFAGGCFRVPGEHYRIFEDLGQQEPPDHQFTHRCRQCFPSSLEVRPSSPSSDSASSSSSSSGAAETPGADPDECV